MPPLTLTYHTDALRCLTIGGGLSVCALSGSENSPPHATGGKGLKTDENGARAAGGHKARLCPACGAQTCLVVRVVFRRETRLNHCNNSNSKS